MSISVHEVFIVVLVVLVVVVLVVVVIVIVGVVVASNVVPKRDFGQYLTQTSDRAMSGLQRLPNPESVL